jgi:hypothetical protein
LKFIVLVAMCEPCIVFWDVTLCSLVERYELVGERRFLHLEEFDALEMKEGSSSRTLAPVFQKQDGRFI